MSARATKARASLFCPANNAGAAGFPGLVSCRCFVAAAGSLQRELVLAGPGIGLMASTDWRRRRADGRIGVLTYVRRVGTVDAVPTTPILGVASRRARPEGRRTTRPK